MPLIRISQHHFFGQRHRRSGDGKSPAATIYTMGLLKKSSATRLMTEENSLNFCSLRNSQKGCLINTNCPRSGQNHWLRDCLPSSRRNGFGHSQIIRQGSRYGIKLRAIVSIHMIVVEVESCLNRSSAPKNNQNNCWINHERLRRKP